MLTRTCRYDDSLIDILYQFGPVPRMPLSEAEAFSGSILGRQGGAQGKPLRELSKQLRERFDTIAEYTIMRIIHGDAAVEATEHIDELYDVDERELEGWPRAIACLIVAVEETGARDYRLGELESFRYLAAVVCLKEFQRYLITTLGRYSLPRLI